MCVGIHTYTNRCMWQLYYYSNNNNYYNRIGRLERGLWGYSKGEIFLLIN